jgi:regulator of protease activity HflC (stomatin/prohibitin superfamily)
LAAGVLAAIAVAVLLLFALMRALRIVPQGHNAVIARMARYSRTAEPGMTVLMPFADQVLAMVDMREQVLTFTPQHLITSDEFAVTVEPVVTLQVTDARVATLEIADYAQAVERLTVAALRNAVGGLRRAQVRSSRAWVATEVRGVLDEVVGRWGIRLGGFEIKLSR